MTVTKIIKYPRRIMRQKVRGVRVAITDGAPAWMRTLFAPTTHYADMLLVAYARRLRRSDPGALVSESPVAASVA